MLEPREADIPALFLFLVVLPLVTYVFLGKYNEVAKKKAKITKLAQLAAEEALRVEVMATADVIPIGSSFKAGMHECARCFGPATTRCSRCKSVRYCSGKCQIIHWRQGHKQECQKLENSTLNLSSTLASMVEFVQQRSLADENLRSPFIENVMTEPTVNNISSPYDPSVGYTPQVSSLGRKLSDKRVSHAFTREILTSEEDGSCPFRETDSFGATSPSQTESTLFPELLSNEAPRKHKLGNNNCSGSDEIPRRQDTYCPLYAYVSTTSGNIMDQSHNSTGQTRSAFKPSTPSDFSVSVLSDKIEIYARESERELSPEKVNVLGGIYSPSCETADLCSSTEKIQVKGGTKYMKPPYTLEPVNSLSQSSPQKGQRDYPSPGIERKACTGREPNILAHSSNDNLNIGDKKIARSRKLPKLPKQNLIGIMALKKNKVLFPYEDLIKLFQCEACDISPRGLLNCGNSCYANAVMQCLTCTKPLVVYLLRRMHSKACRVRDWCLMCELELHVSMLLEGGGPLSPSRILSNMRKIGCRMGGGNQEDAHEFLRLLVMSMQSICLEDIGGEKEVELSLQETTLIQQIFGGRLQSKVKCLRCRLESERYENIMDLTLEIHGWVESLEDALTQFTSPEDLDGENMYRCGRCSSYVKARKQLSVHEAPNILTIVLKRFQTGKYGKINKCVTFPDMLDMIPFMTGTGDSPPLYMLYAVVVHLDTSNASFSGHYVSYVKDLQGMWFRIDDAQVQAVPLSQVMSEGAYMLFYSRSFPRPPRIYLEKSIPSQGPISASKSQKTSKHGPTKPNGILFTSDGSSNMVNDLRIDPSDCIAASRNILPTKDSFTESSVSRDFSDATSSDWSLFTSSDESSFTTESTSDSFSTIDYGDAANLDPISSLFSPFYVPEYSQNSSTSSCTKFSHFQPQTRFFPESKGFVLDSSMHDQPVRKEREPRMGGISEQRQ